MEKLTLKELSGYFPYGLKGISSEENLGAETVNGYSLYGKNNQVCLTTNIDDIDIEVFKPVLRPLSDLTKEITHNGETFVPDVRYLEVFGLNNDYLSEFLFVKTSHRVEYLTKLPHYAVDWLTSLHFDVHGLIERGLAINVNELEENPYK